MAIVFASMAAEIYLPAMPELQHWLGCSTAQLQQTISIYLFGLASAQVIAGPIIDRFDYRHIGLMSCILFIVASAVCALSRTLELLLIARLFQAIAAGLLATIGRASLPNRFSQQEVVKLYLIISPILASSLTISPLIGGYLTSWFSWRAVFYFSAVLGVGCFALIYCYLRFEIKQHECLSIHPISIVKTYFSLFKNSQYCAAVIGVCIAYGALFAFLTEIPFNLHKLGLTSSEIGNFYVLLSVTYIIASQIVRRLLKLISAHTLTYIGLWFELVGVGLLYVLSYHGLNSFYQLIFPSLIIGIANGIIVPLLMGKGISLFKQKAGYASGLISACCFFASAIATATVNAVTHGFMSSLALFMGGLYLVGLLGYFAFSSLDRAQ